MNFLKNKLFLGLAFAAAVVFLSLSLGGNFLHQRLHHHATQAEQNDCPVYQLTAQWLLAGVAFVLAASFVCVQTFVSLRNSFPFDAWRIVVNPRAPPVTLS